MVMRWKLMRKDAFDNQILDVIEKENMIKKEIFGDHINRLLTKYDKLILKRCSVETWEKDFKKVTFQVENFWWQWRKRHLRKKCNLQQNSVEEYQDEDEYFQIM